MDKHVVIQPSLTMMGGADTGSATLYPPNCKFVDVSPFPSGVCQVKIPHTSGTLAVLAIQTAINEEGPWTDIATFNGPTVATLYLSRDPSLAAGQQMQRLLRWELTTVNHTWQYGMTGALMLMLRCIWL